MHQTFPARSHAPNWNRRSHFGAATAILVTAVLLGAGSAGCRIARATAKLPGRAVTAVVPPARPEPPDPSFVQARLQRFADEYANRTTVVLDEYASRAKTDEERARALRWKIAAATTAVTIAGGPDPQANLLDFLALTTVTRMTLEDVWIKTPDGAAFQPWLDCSKALEAEAWTLASIVMSRDQQQEVRDAIRSWWEANPDVRQGFFGRPQELSTLIRRTASRSPRPGSIFSVVGLDPTAGLDPAVREVTRSRLFAERAMFMAERMPFLLRWQIELITDDLLRQGQVVRTVDSAERIGRATESVSKTAAELPERITAERKAILEALETQEGKLRELSADVTHTLTAGEKMSTSLNATLKTFDALMQRFGVGDQTPVAPPDPGAPPDSASPPDFAAPPGLAALPGPAASTAPAASPGPAAPLGPSSSADRAPRRFDILDYAKTAEQVTAMSKELNEVIKELNTSLDSPALDARIVAVNRVSDHAVANVRGLIYLVFALAGGLVVLAFVCAWTYRAGAHRGATSRAGLESRPEPSPAAPSWTKVQ
jgi:hypothetical protein